MAPKTVKCLVWDLDDTVWDGVLLEGDDPRPRPGLLGVLRTLDSRGILQAVASRGEHGLGTFAFIDNGRSERDEVRGALSSPAADHVRVIAEPRQALAIAEDGR